MAASFELKITKNGSTLVELTDGSKYLIDRPYHMKAKAPDVATTKESLNLIVLGSDYATARGYLNDLVDALQQAQNFWRHPGYGDEPVYLEVKIESSDDWFRSLLHPESEITDIDVDVANMNGKIPCRLNIVRDNFWEGEEVVLPLSNTNGSNGPVFLSNDGTTEPMIGGTSLYNWLTFSAQTGFDLPSPLKLGILLTPSYHANILRLIINNFRVNKTTETGFAYYFEAESGSGDGSNAADTTCSGGNKRTFTLSSDSVQTVSFSMSSARLDIYNGRNILPVVRFAETTNLNDIQVRVRIDNANTIFESEWVNLDDSQVMQRLPVIPVPRTPNVLLSSFIPVGFEIDFRRKTSSTEVVNLDFLELFFADSVVIFTSEPNAKAVASDFIYITPYDRFVEGYTLYGSSTYRGNMTKLGSEDLLIYPGESGYLAFAWEPASEAGSYPYAEGFYVTSAFYRPRRLTL